MARPFLKWAGGKGQLLNTIVNNLPPHFDTYIEPFVGSGAVVFALLSRGEALNGTIINDLNSDLINAYLCVCEDCEGVTRQLANLQARYLELDGEGRSRMYYEIREDFNRREADATTRASHFIFLNRTCFNGLYRVNAHDHFNVPHGKYKAPTICDERNLSEVSAVLQNVDIRNGDFEALRADIGPGCFVYLDPPYKPISDTSSFNSYSAEKFDDHEQTRLKLFCDYINECGGFFMLSNSDPASVNPNNRFFDELYGDYHIQRVLARRAINANADRRGEVNELLITNY